MKNCFFACLAASLFATVSLLAVDTAHVDRHGNLVIQTTQPRNLFHRDRNPVYYVNLPPTVVSPPNNLAYSQAAITKDFIFLSGVTGQLLNGDPVPIPPGSNGFAQFNQAYANLVNILTYLGASPDDVVKLEVDIVAPDNDTFLLYRATANAIQATIWPTGSPPRTIRGVTFLNLGSLEVSATVANNRRIIVRHVDETSD